MTRKARLVIALAIVGAIPLTAGVLIWVIGAVMSAGFYGGWTGFAGAGKVTALAGLLLGLVMIVLAASGRREVMRARPRRTRDHPGDTPPPPDQSLLPVAPEHQAFLADPSPQPEQPPPPGTVHPPAGEQPLVEQGPPGTTYPPAGEQPPVEQGPPPGMAFPPLREPPGSPYPEAGHGYPPSGEPYPPGAAAPPHAAGTYPPAQRPWPVPGTFGTGGPPDGQPYYAGRALPLYQAQPDDTYPGFPADSSPPFTVIPDLSGAGPQPVPSHPPGHGGAPPPGDDYPDFRRERGFPVPPESRGEGGYRRLASPEEWW